MWIHESFTNYSEALFIEYHKGKKIAEDYVVGLRKKIANDIPIIGTYGVNREGSGDMYNKGGNMIHTIRKIINDDYKFRALLLEMNLKFKHKTVTTQEIENFMIEFSGKNLKPIFDQYLRSIKIPELLIKHKEETSFTYKWNNVVPGFDMPVKVYINGKYDYWIYPSSEEQTFKFSSGMIEEIKADQGFYISMKSIAN
jgi:aminopeptidase N